MGDIPRQSLNTYIRDYFAAAQQPVNGAYWLRKREIPTGAEVLRLEATDQTKSTNAQNEVVELPQNKLVGKWRSKEDYLTAHYELIREDIIGPFSQAVEDFRDRTPGKENETFCAYEKVHIKGFTFSPQGIAARITFSFKRAGKRIIWEQSKRLIAGSLIALSPMQDRFQTTCLVAVVAARPLDGVKQTPPEMDVFFAAPEEMEFDPQKEWVMVEAKNGFFESARYTLAALQKLMAESLPSSFPLSEHFIRLRRNIQPPTYLQNDPYVNLSETDHDGPMAKQIDLINSWPEFPGNHLDASQWAALQQILTKRLSIIQGPPGTGKTHVSVIALRVMLEKMKSGDPPIIVTAQTNHALDQLLLHVSRFEGNFIRLGGQSQDRGIIRDRTLYEVRRTSPNGRDPPGCLRASAHNKVRHLAKEFSKILYPFQNHQEPLPAVMFRDMGLLTEAQHESLINGANQIVRFGRDHENLSPMATWLGDDLEPFPVKYENDNIGFEEEEEEDLEYEQLKELEAEQGLTDDDDRDILRGVYFEMIEPFTARRTTRLTRNAIEKFLSCKDLWKIPPQARSGMYRHLQNKAKEVLLHELRKKAKEYDAACRQLKIGKWERDATLLEGTKLIGMTTTGFSKYRPLIASLKPRIVLIEEAAEIIEGPVMVTCVDSLEHLILIGDHKQLQGHCTQQELEGDPFYLDISLFQRLVTNGMPYKTLIRQRRMNPEISRLLEPIYGELEDHEVVKNREDVPGMGGVNSFFFCHSWAETTDDYMSKCNVKEAEMIARFFSYLHLNGVPVDRITILTFYNGQRKKILQKLRQQSNLIGFYFKVVTVDSYQGEENDVVLLSLVRSNGRRNIGFLSVENRVCVALSRAKRGLYIFGNGEDLCLANRLWWEVLKIMENEPRRIGFSLPIVCTKHGRRVWVKDVSDWDDLAGGCDRRCPENMPCGHQCPMNCHPFPHDRVECPAPCRRIVPCKYEHQCVEKCHARPCRCKCFAKGLGVHKDLDISNRVTEMNEDPEELDDIFSDRFEKLQVRTPRSEYDGPASLIGSSGHQNGPPLLFQARNGGYSSQVVTPRRVQQSPSIGNNSQHDTPRQFGRPLNGIQPRSEDAEAVNAWGEYAAGGHVKDDARLFAEAESRYDLGGHERYKEWLRGLAQDSVEHGFLGDTPVAATPHSNSSGEPMINLMD